jgi:hypothetical protein
MIDTDQANRASLRRCQQLVSGWPVCTSGPFLRADAPFFTSAFLLLFLSSSAHSSGSAMHLGIRMMASGNE